jgi:diguanylate cyclase (GGDEF)-like protein
MPVSPATTPEAWTEPGLDAALEMAGVLSHVIEQVRTADDLVPALGEAASLAALGLGFGTVTINLARPLHDDFPVVVTEGPTANQEALAGTAVPRHTTEVVLQPRFERLGCHVILAGELDWDTEFDAPLYTPDIAPSADPRLWNADDALVLALRARDGDLLGLMWLDEPLDGLRPSDAQLQLAAVIGLHAAHAIEEATAVVRAHEHRLALSHLLATATMLHDKDVEKVLEAICAGIHHALAFDRVAVMLHEEGAAPRSAIGWTPAELDAWPGMETLQRLLDPALTRAGCHLLTREQAAERGLPRAGAATPHDGVAPAPRAWDDHTLVVAMRTTCGDLLGVICADAPSDGLLPDEDRLRALRLFADQASTAVALAHRHEELRALARRDALTGLGNRTAFTEQLDRLLRVDGGVSLVLCDIDDFKRINDSRGHLAGDDALRGVAEEIRVGIRGTDTGFRLAGDEFCVLLPGASQAAAVAACERLGNGFARRGVSASFGIATAEPHDSPDTLLARADARLYEAKRARSRS